MNGRAFNNRGHALFYLGDLAGARRDLNRAILLRPDYGLAFRNRGDVRAAMGFGVEACRDWIVALRFEEEGPGEARERLDEFCSSNAGNVAGN